MPDYTEMWTLNAQRDGLLIDTEFLNLIGDHVSAYNGCQVSFSEYDYNCSSSSSTTSSN
jgi:hypothetical protein